MATKRKILFVCTGNLDRSPTAERIYKNRENLEVKSAGTSTSAKRILTGDLIEWADLIFVMEDHHKKYITDWQPEAAKKIVVLGVMNKYLRDDPELIRILQEKIDYILRG